MVISRQAMVVGMVASVFGAGGTALAQNATLKPQPLARFADEPRVIVPPSSVQHPGDASVQAHTNIRVLNVEAAPNATGPVSLPGFYETPASLACIYGLVAATAGCNPTTATTNAIGGSKVVAIVDAYDYPTALADLTAYSTQFGLPAPNLQVVYASGKQPPQDKSGGWELEAALDISMVHALAPQAKIILVEAASNRNADLFLAEQVASSLVSIAGGGEVSNSWGEQEFPDEVIADVLYFSTPGTVYFASSGDNPGTEYPSVSPNVVAVGGTSIGRNPATGDFQYQITWDLDGGGLSLYEGRPSYQNAIATTVGPYRGVPDIALDANPETGVWVYDSVPMHGVSGWWVVGGTSVASPAAAAIVNAAGSFASSSAQELKKIYANRRTTADFTDIVYGTCGPYDGYVAGKGWDPCTGVGTPLGLGGK